jgi:hypothetical protein
MMKATSFLRGMGAGMIAGVTIGAITAMKRDAMRTGVGRAMQHASSAMDNALFELWHSMQ